MFWSSKTTSRKNELVVKNPQLAMDKARRKISALVQEHLQTLGRRRMALIKIDAYGVVDAKGWIAECQHFVDKVILPSLEIDEVIIVKPVLNKVMTELLEGPAREECARIETNFHYDEKMSPLDYERFCASRLESVGWKCELTRASGDQGADVIARKNGRVLVLQCKKYGSSVGNGAVQEVVAAKGHLHGDYAAVVSNAEFTRSAIDLASSTRTLLLHHAELDAIDGRLKSA